MKKRQQAGVRAIPLGVGGYLRPVAGVAGRANVTRLRWAETASGVPQFPPLISLRTVSILLVLRRRMQQLSEAASICFGAGVGTGGCDEF